MAYKMNDTTEKNVFQVTFPLYPNQEEHDFLDKYFDASLMTEHHLTSRVLKRLANMERTRAWRNNEAAISVLYEKLKNKAITKKQFNAEKKQLFEVKEDMIKKNGLDKEEFLQDVTEMEKMLEGYLSFVSGEGGEEPSFVDLNEMILSIINKFRTFLDI